ncbi:MAG: hypothetical protein HC912_07050 [Saprospiraceae bacterium]|nr:hypothetical protein [Saprospiraceae bacterium]
MVARIADNIFIIKDGEIIEHGDQYAIFQDPKSDYTKALLMAQPPIYKKIYRLPSLSSQEMFEEQVPSKKNNQDTTEILKVNKLNTWFTKNKKSIFEKKTYLKSSPRCEL